ncbi:hypothetical protein GCM10023115_19120 [Pontixanthobacter gangjinensis]|uniref:DUF3429 family protein n=1 Tax=Pontixanthobacter gangjinensis TaxID=1028742 RepID=A0A6I4SMM8_9SPHN|nr:DUF3429 domain-containing protein [Pontixanthobacter gangjinensis]MXO57161.1 DUF3429 family protein [Pontixanthobacter gangjinensis]
MNNDIPPQSFRWVRLLGYSGLLPQVLALYLFLAGGEWGWIALAGGFAYAALIFSFLGGVWWGQSLANPDAPKWAYAAAVLPSLIGLGLFLPWTLGWAWPEPSLLWLGLFLMVSPLVDRKLGLGGSGWIQLRWHLSTGLGLLTFALGIVSLAVRP